MRKLVGTLATVGALALCASPALAGQPNASCEDPGANPPPGFSSGGFAHAETVYAGEDGTASAAHAHSSHAVSQYDVACVGGRTR
jgi:hypothetical protein